VRAVEHDHPRAGAERRRAGGDHLAQRLGQAVALEADRHRGRLAARDDQAVDPVQVRRGADFLGRSAELLEHAGVRLEAALKG
jgi:hypothetical protein